LRNTAPIRIGCEHALMAYEAGAKWEQSLHLLEEMYAHGIDPNEDTFMPIVRACENAGHFEEADKLFWQMREKTKLMKVEEEMVLTAPNKKKPPQAELTPWRIPGAVALYAYDPPNLLKPPKKKRTKTSQSSSAS